MADDELLTSAFRRFTALGGLAGRVGASVLASRIGDLARGDVARAAHHTEMLVRNATRIAETLGRMKGGAMKVGQMLSLHADMLPPEVAAVLRTLQAQATPVPAEIMEFEARGQLRNFDELFASFEPEACAAASIGQVHRATLRDGRAVVVKIQYPAIDQIIRADLKNLKAVFQSLFALFTDAEFDPIWQEIRERLLEELDYLREAATIERMRGLWADAPEITIPAVVREATTAHVLTMERVDGIAPDAACSDAYDAALRDHWGRSLFGFIFRGLFVHRLLHADPNLSNFAFRPDGGLVVYDFGCAKEVPEGLAAGYARVMHAAIEGRRDDIPLELRDLGVRYADGAALPASMTTPFVELFSDLLRAEPPYTFGSDPTIYMRLFDLGLSHAREASQLRYPRDIVFVNRTLGGHFGNLARLRATASWRDLALRYLDAAGR
jgi:predicted unusual protein kinase regulating ubiquinone biosynthesis (AarF/ABC1/UbiB family)